MHALRSAGPPILARIVWRGLMLCLHDESHRAADHEGRGGRLFIPPVWSREFNDTPLTWKQDVENGLVIDMPAQLDRHECRLG